MSIVHDLEMSRMRKAMVSGLRIVGWLLLVTVWAAWLGSLGLWFVSSPLGVMWPIAWGWIPEEAASAATFSNVGGQLVLLFSGLVAVMHHACEIWPFGRKVQA